MKFHPYIWFGFWFDWFTTYVIEDGCVAIKKRFSGASNPIDIGSADVEILNTGFFKTNLFGFGDIRIRNSNNNEVVLKNVRSVKEKAEYIRNYGRIKQGPQGKTEPEKRPIPDNSSNRQKNENEAIPPIPDHVEFSDQIILLPRPARMLGYFQNHLHEKKDYRYRWINAGDLLGYYEFPTSVSGFIEPEAKTTVKVEIKSPISGIVLSCENGFYHNGYDRSPEHETSDFFKILIPEGEMPAFSAEEMYRDAYQTFLRYRNHIIKTMRNTYFLKTLEQFYHGDLKDSDTLGEFLKKDFDSAPCEYIYKDITYDYFIDFIETLKQQRPEYSKKLQKFDCAKIRFESALDAYEKGRYFGARINFERALPWHSDPGKHAEACYLNAREDEAGLTIYYNRHEKLDDMHSVKEIKKLYEMALKINTEHEQARNALECVNQAIRENNIDMILQANSAWKKEQQKADSKKPEVGAFGEADTTRSQGEKKHESSSEKENHEAKGSAINDVFSDQENEIRILMIKWQLSDGFTHVELEQKLVLKLKQDGVDPVLIRGEYLKLEKHAA